MKLHEALDRQLTRLTGGSEGQAGVDEDPEALPADLKASLHAAQQLQAWRPEMSAEADARIRRSLKQWARRNRLLSEQGAPRFALGRVAATALALIAAILLGSAGALSASAGALPGDLLYPAKRAAEALEQALPVTTGQATAHLRLAARRLDELVALVQRPNTNPVLVASTAREATGEGAAALATLDPTTTPPNERARILEQVIRLADRQEHVLTTYAAEAPPETAAILQVALVETTHSRAQAALQLTNLEASLPTAMPPEPAAQGHAADPLTPGQATRAAAAPATDQTGPMPPSADTTEPGPPAAEAPALAATFASGGADVGGNPGQPTQEGDHAPVTPPGQAQTPPGQAQTPPGQEKKANPPTTETPGAPPTPQDSGQGHHGQPEAPPTPAECEVNPGGQSRCKP